MSDVCMKHCFIDWFESSNTLTRRNAEIYYNDMGPMRNEDDADLVPWFGFNPGSHSSMRVAGDVRKDTFHFYGDPEAFEFLKSENVKDIAKRELLAWKGYFDKYEIWWHPFLYKIVRTLKDEFGMGDVYEEYCKGIESHRASE